MNISSLVFKNQETIPSKYTCDGENVNPPLQISNVPDGAQSLVLIMDDPDSPSGAWVHWTVWNIGPQTSEIAENSIPAGAIEGMTGFGEIGYGGPCPHSGTHRYFFLLYDLDAKLDVPRGADNAKLENAMEGHILTKAELTGLYRRQNP
ncbi:MAG: YbhB/YbcL family Raf kinase inhibitor-like protein [bacterium]|nr:YbhB/YbcL family Raf kinase inhibitor-like protein [bacterium]